MSFDKIIPTRYLYRYRGGVLCHGCFDLLHIGHIRYLHWARRQLARGPLVATLTADAFFPGYKGEGRPAFPEHIRAEWLAAICVVDAVAIVHHRTAIPAIEMMRPEVYAKGHTAEGMIPEETDATIAAGGRVVFMPPDSDGYSQEYASGRILSGQYLRSRIVAQKIERGVYDYE